MNVKFMYLLIFSVLLTVLGCGKKEYFDDYLPIETGSKWVFEDDEGDLAEIEVIGDSLNSDRNTVFSIFFLGDNIEFIKTPSAVSWHFLKRVVVEDKEIIMEDRFYPFFEFPFIDGKLERIVYESRDEESDVYFRRTYEYEYAVHGRDIQVNIVSDMLYVYSGDTTTDVVSYVFTLSPDTGFTRIIYSRNGRRYTLNLVEYKRGNN